MSHLKLCRCGKPIPLGLSRCKVCKDKQKNRHKSYDNTRRDQRSNAFYKSKEWRELRKRIIARDHGLCQRCLKENRIRPGNICHHIIELKENWSRRLDENNIEYVCSACHNKIHG